MRAECTLKPIFVAGATGYVGGRLVPRLLERGYQVRALVRAPEKIEGRSWGTHPNLHIFKGDVLDRTSMTQALRGCRAAFYLIHSMSPEVSDFSSTDRIAAQNMTQAAASAGLEQIIYLGGLGEENPELSHHLRSRAEVGQILHQGSVPVTILRAAMIIGSGSASFEMLRYLVDRLPIIIAPRKVDTPCQPIGIRNVIYYLIGCLEHPEVIGETFDIGQPEVTNYCELMRIYAEEAGLPRRRIVQLPFLSARISAYWIHFITPISVSLARPLAQGLKNPVVCRENRITTIIPQELHDARIAIRRALMRTRQLEVETAWSDSGELPPVEWSTEGDPDWAGGSMFEDARRVVLDATPEQIWPSITSVGGDTGYYYANWLWKIRGFMDQLFGGFGLLRGRRSSKVLHPGDAIDFWRVVQVRRLHTLVLSAEMKLPGEAALLFRLKPADDGRTEVQQIARFLPKGLLGLAYWYSVMPFHHFVFNGMLRGVALSTGAPLLQGPEHFDASTQE
ncbi:MAG: SDR family oxidoreductase [Desulfuromonadaceae bacterium]|nr:SDR family oxidoreductase [Desulfuromonadaceae bacterium]